MSTAHLIQAPSAGLTLLRASCRPFYHRYFLSKFFARVCFLPVAVIMASQDQKLCGAALSDAARKKKARGFNLELPLNQWVLWLLEWIAGAEGQHGQLMGLVASDHTNERGVTIEHRLFAHIPGESGLRRRPLCRDAYRPLAFSRKRRELVFSGAEGTYLLGLGGERRSTLLQHQCSIAHGACFDPSGGPRVALAAGGIHLWNLEKDQCERLTDRGRHPVWSSDGKRLFLRESSSDLHCLDLETAELKRVVAVAKQPERELWFARPIRFSASGRYAVLPLTARRLRGVQKNASSSGQSERVYRYAHAAVVMDFEYRELWQSPGFATELQWLG